MSPKEASDEGLQLIDVAGDQGLEGVTATVSFAGDEVELRYQLEGLHVGSRSLGSPPRGKWGDDGNGVRRGPSKDDVERFPKLNEENRNQLKQYIGHVMKTYPSLSREERGNMIRGAMTRLGGGRPLDFAQPSISGGQPSPE